MGFRGDSTVRYAEVVFGGDSMTMVVQIFGGRRAMIKAPMLIFINTNGNYSIRGLEDNVPGVLSNRSKRMDGRDYFPIVF